MQSMKIVNTGDYASTQALVPSDYVTAKVLAADTAETVNVPAGARFVVFASDNNFYADFNGNVLTIPAADVDDGTAPVLNPAVRYIDGKTSFSLIAAADCVVTMEWFA